MSSTEKAVRALHTKNPSCFVCRDKATTNVLPGSDFNYVWVCQPCGGLARAFGVRVKGVSMSNWTDAEVAAMTAGGNKKMTPVFWGHFNREADGPVPSGSRDSAEKVRPFLQALLIDRRWHIDNPSNAGKAPHITAASEAAAAGAAHGGRPTSMALPAGALEAAAAAGGLAPPAAAGARGRGRAASSTAAGGSGSGGPDLWSAMDNFYGGEQAKAAAAAAAAGGSSGSGSVDPFAPAPRAPAAAAKAPAPAPAADDWGISFDAPPKAAAVADIFALGASAPAPAPAAVAPGPSRAAVLSSLGDLYGSAAPAPARTPAPSMAFGGGMGMGGFPQQGMGFGGMGMGGMPPQMGMGMGIMPQQGFYGGGGSYMGSPGAFGAPMAGTGPSAVASAPSSPFDAAPPAAASHHSAAGAVAAAAPVHAPAPAPAAAPAASSDPFADLGNSLGGALTLLGGGSGSSSHPRAAPSGGFGGMSFASPPKAPGPAAVDPFATPVAAPAPPKPAAAAGGAAAFDSFFDAAPAPAPAAAAAPAANPFDLF